MNNEKPLPVWALAAISLLSLLVVSFADLVTGDEFLFFVFYFVPVSIAAWYLGWSAGLTMALLSGASWFVVDKISGHTYAHEAVRYWNGCICFAAFATIALALHRLRCALVARNRSEQALQKALDELKQSTEEIRKLQSNLQVVCAWTKRIRIDGEWVALDKFLAEKLHFSISHGISPEALEEAKKYLKEHAE